MQISLYLKILLTIVTGCLVLFVTRPMIKEYKTQRQLQQSIKRQRGIIHEVFKDLKIPDLKSLLHQRKK